MPGSCRRHRHKREQAFGVSRQTTTTYLKGIPRGIVVHDAALNAAAKRFFEENGFLNIEGISTISRYPATDFIATRGKEKWSINIRSRSLALYGDDIFMGALRVLEGYRNAVVILDTASHIPPIFIELKEIKSMEGQKTSARQ